MSLDPGGAAAFFSSLSAVGHDQLFKDFLRAFLRDFLELFFPGTAARLNFETARFLDKELFTDIPEGSLREADLVAEVEAFDGEAELILIHIEVQAEREREFAERMFQYYALLWLRYGLPILPIVVYLSGGEGGVFQETYRVRLLEREVLRFVYDCVGLSALSAEEYGVRENPVAAALAALMDRTGIAEPLTLRALMLERVARSGLDDARKFLLLNCIETYFPLGSDEGEAFARLCQHGGLREVATMQVTWADRMMEKGRQEGHEKGREEGLQAGAIEAKREVLLRLLHRKFGPLPEEVKTRVRTVLSIDELDTCLDRLVTARSLEEMQLGI